MKYRQFDIVFQEVPNEVSLCFAISGCPLKCKNCSWEGFTDIERDPILSLEVFTYIMQKYSNYVTCVVFMGGEWEIETLKQFLDEAKTKYNLKTCLYTGLEDIDKELKSKLDYVKVGPYVEELGSLDKNTTNQKFIDLKTNKCLNSLFQK